MSRAAVGRAASEPLTSRQQAVAALQRALEISRQLAAAADGGDVALTVTLDAERRRLLKWLSRALQPLNDEDRQVLREIAELNDRSIGLLEHRFRAYCRDMDMLAVGRRAVRAYSTTRP